MYSHLLAHVILRICITIFTIFFSDLVDWHPVKNFIVDFLCVRRTLQRLPHSANQANNREPWSAYTRLWAMNVHCCLRSEVFKRWIVIFEWFQSYDESDCGRRLVDTRTCVPNPAVCKLHARFRPDKTILTKLNLMSTRKPQVSLHHSLWSLLERPIRISDGIERRGRKETRGENDSRTGWPTIAGIHYCELLGFFVKHCRHRRINCKLCAI